jgi:hypothetical protein
MIMEDMTAPPGFASVTPYIFADVEGLGAKELCVESRRATSDRAGGTARAPAHCEEPLVPRYFMHLVDSTDVLRDPDGVVIPAELVERVALRAARDCMAGDVKHGRLDLRYRIDVHDENGKVVHRLAFPDAVEVLFLEAVN